jgi:hypothetical protein
LAVAVTAALTSAAPSPVQVIDSNIVGPHTSALTSAPTSLPGAQKAFLDKYQPTSNAASDFIGQKERDHFTSAGLCYAEYPCFSIQNAAIAAVGTAPAISQDQMSGFLDYIMQMPTVTFQESPDDHAYTGLKLNQNGVVLDVISPPGMIAPSAMAGMVFDLYKIQAGEPSVNSIRGLQAASDLSPYANVALCLYPSTLEGADITNFCAGKELNGDPMAKPGLTKRFSIEALFAGFCHTIDIPLLCP